MSAVQSAVVVQALRTIRPNGGADIVARDMVTGLAVRETPEGAHVSFALEIDPAEAKAMEPVRAEAERAVRAIPGVAQVSAVMTAHRAASGAGGEGKPMAGRQQPLDGVRHIIAVASGKGGVGKSTVAANLAVALAQRGLRVGLLDADVFGPSMPRMMGVGAKPELDEHRKMMPLAAHGVRVMSIGFLVGEDTPMVWRGPMVHGAITQMLRDVAWAPLDVLLVDMPPGTGDVQLTMAQTVPLSGAVIVSTPQDIALIDVRRGIAMFEKVRVPILGVIENMSQFVCPHCGEASAIFGHGGAEREAERLHAPFLGAVPLDLAVRIAADGGTPIVAGQPNSPQSKAFQAIAARLGEGLAEGA